MRIPKIPLHCVVEGEGSTRADVKRGKGPKNECMQFATLFYSANECREGGRPFRREDPVRLKKASLPLPLLLFSSARLSIDGLHW